jgi:hypothetical protein
VEADRERELQPRQQQRGGGIGHSGDSPSQVRDAL